MEEIERDSGRDMTPQLIKDLGMRYPTEKSVYKSRYGLYECQYCGREWETMVKSVKCGDTKSCGCQKVNTLSIKHGLCNNRFYATWNNIFKRCTNPNHNRYKDYGGRGITVCEEWLDIRNFVAWCESTYPNIDGMTLDRIDNDKGYSPDNVRWTDASTQALNKRIKKSNTSGFVGISAVGKKWGARIKIFNKDIWVGTFNTIEEAVLARDNYITQNNLPHKLSTDYIKEK